MQLVHFVANDGQEVFINPAHVVWVKANGDGGSAIQTTASDNGFFYLQDEPSIVVAKLERRM